MKRLVCAVVYFLMLFLSVAAMADQTYLGSWANMHETENAGTVLTTFRLFPDHSAVYISQEFPDGEIVSGSFSWEEIDSSAFRIIGNKNEPLGEFYLLNKNRIEDKQKNVFVRISFEAVPEPAPVVTSTPSPTAAAEKVVPGNLQDGFLLYPGQYIIGKDLPAGDYRFEYYEAPVDIFVHKDPDSSMWSGFASVTKNSPIFAKINLPEGGRLNVGAFPVIIMYAKPLNIGE